MSVGDTSDDEGIEEILGTFESDILHIVGEEFAPKQEHSSSERKRLLGLLSKTYEAKKQAEDKLKSREAAIEKAYGGCHKCYGKGYATVIEYASGYDTDQDIGSPGGKVHFRTSPMKFCTCERGKQLQKFMTTD